MSYKTNWRRLEPGRDVIRSQIKRNEFHYRDHNKLQSKIHRKSFAGLTRVNSDVLRSKTKGQFVTLINQSHVCKNILRILLQNIQTKVRKGFPWRTSTIKKNSRHRQIERDLCTNIARSFFPKERTCLSKDRRPHYPGSCRSSYMLSALEKRRWQCTIQWLVVPLLEVLASKNPFLKMHHLHVLWII